MVGKEMIETHGNSASSTQVLLLILLSPHRLLVASSHLYQEFDVKSMNQGHLGYECFGIGLSCTPVQA